MRKFVLCLALACAVLPLAACSSGGGTSAGGNASSTSMTSSSASAPAAADTIVINDFMFQPMSITVAPGATVTVTNKDTATHTMTSTGSPPAFNTGDIAPGKSVTFKAPDKPGSYAYICQIHQYMQGTLTVS